MLTLRAMAILIVTISCLTSRAVAEQHLWSKQFGGPELQEAWGNCTVQLFSSLKKQGVEEAEKIIGAWLNPPAEDAPEEIEATHPE